MQNTSYQTHSQTSSTQRPHSRTVAGWSSPVARQAHNLKVTGSNPVPATIFDDTPSPAAQARGLSLFLAPFLSLASSHSSMAPNSPFSVTWTSPRFAPGVSVTRSISPRMASAASSRSSGRFSASADVPPVFSFQLELESDPGKGRTDEAEAVFGRADHRHPEGSRGRCGGDRSVSPARDVERDLLRPESQVGALEVLDAKQLRAIEAENARLERLLATRCWTILSRARRRGRSEGPAGKKMVTPAAKREAVTHLQTALGMSERRACAVVGADRKSMRYRSSRADDGDLRSRLRELA